MRKQQARVRFAMQVQRAVAESALEPEELADSLLEMIIGMYLGAGLDRQQLLERVNVAWEECSTILATLRADEHGEN